MAKLGYTWYPKDWNNSDKVFELTLIERGLYRELIDMAMLNNNTTEINYKVWGRRFGSNESELEGILITLDNLKLIEVKDNQIFIPSCEPRLNLSRGGKLGGEKSRKNKPTHKPIVKPTPNQKKDKRKEKKLFRECNLFDKVEFKKAFPEWGKDKLSYYYEQALAWSNEGNEKIDWKATVRTWASRDEKQGKIKFASSNPTNINSGII